MEKDKWPHGIEPSEIPGKLQIEHKLPVLYDVTLIDDEARTRKQIALSDPMIGTAFTVDGDQYAVEVIEGLRIEARRQPRVLKRERRSL